MRINSIEELINTSKIFKNSLEQQQKQVLVCGGTGCVAGGALEVYDEIKRLIEERGLLAQVELYEEERGIGVKKSGCHGFCEAGPLVRIEPDQFLYLKVKREDCKEIVETTLIDGKPVERLMYHTSDKVYHVQEEIPFYKSQTRLVLEHCGHIDSESIQEYIAYGGYQALAKAMDTMTPSEVCKEISDAGLRGRGGGGYPTGKKWSQVLSYASDMKYVICNGDEGDPGAFMDRSLMEGDPHNIIEGMAIAAYGTGASEGYIYVRAEYPLAVARLNKAIEQAREIGLLGKNILGTGLNFDVHVNQGAGAFVCGEGSALIASIEGERGMPRVKAKRTVEEGLWKKPTVLNNVETFANVRHIIMNGAAWYQSYGTKGSAGTKAFALTGNVNNTGLIEVPMGTTLRKIIFEIGGGIRGNKKFKAVQIGGPSGGCLTEEHLDMALDFDSLIDAGAMIGSGGMVIMDEDTCMVEVAKFFMNFTQNESCGKCVPCREGTKIMLNILEKIVSGKGSMEDLNLLEELSDTITNTALCGLGKTAANPVVSSLKYFRDEYLAHVVEKRCPTRTCQGLKVIEITSELCKGCSKCSRICPVGAIDGKIKEPYIINQEKCIKCGACIESCAFAAIKEA
ncbi:NADH-quinone oxidoreductase subunit NuoF [Alkaliphilus oremlandii]|uniref:NADH dehydrogenase (Quinone) n=1 Tax=Alkaliphilus oremlandii (strain OhILAs) TaxID=350688 RepID=A8MFZ8_ALKOO|nr:NADH-quinone oxidoreductase subunit NuoF [Alkaliphilus oremlandii]ABW18536.1 NADH dehydrogenase (quinone) [Alkaliphilus oremlandii OhILAs]